MTQNISSFATVSRKLDPPRPLKTNFIQEVPAIFGWRTTLVVRMLVQGVFEYALQDGYLSLKPHYKSGMFP